MDHLTASFHDLLQNFRSVFCSPSFNLFCWLLTGWVLSPRHRYITELIYASNNIDNGHWSRFHRFFSDNVWSLSDLCLVLAKMLFANFFPSGIIILALDDTLCPKRGLNLFGAGMHHDACNSSKAVKLVTWGHDWVVLSLVISFPFWACTKIFSLPIGFRLYRNLQGNRKGKKKESAGSRPSKKNKEKNKKKDKAKAKNKSKKLSKKLRADGSLHQTRPELGLELLIWIANAFPSFTFVVVADSLYGGKSILSHLPSNVHLISRVHAKGALYAPYDPVADANPSKRGRKPKKGKRLSSMNEWANDSTPWTTWEVDQYGLHGEFSIKVRQGLYYTAGGTRLLTFVLVRDDWGKRPLSIFYCTLLDWGWEQILLTYASRWSIEVAFENAKQLLGFCDPANWKEQAVERTAPMAGVLMSLIVLWFHREGHRHVQFPDRPWYTTKHEPSFGDMLSTLRRLSWDELGEGAVPKQGPIKTLFTKIIEFVSRSG